MTKGQLVMPRRRKETKAAMTPTKHSLTTLVAREATKEVKRTKEQTTMERKTQRWWQARLSTKRTNAACRGWSEWLRLWLKRLLLRSFGRRRAQSARREEPSEGLRLLLLRLHQLLKPLR